MNKDLLIAELLFRYLQEVKRTEGDHLRFGGVLTQAFDMPELSEKYEAYRDSSRAFYSCLGKLYEEALDRGEPLEDVSALMSAYRP